MYFQYYGIGIRDALNQIGGVKFRESGDGSLTHVYLTYIGYKNKNIMTFKRQIDKKKRKLLIFAFLMCGVLSANAQLDDNTVAVVNDDSISYDVVPVSKSTIGFGGKHNRIKTDYNFGWFISKFIDKNGNGHRGLFGLGLSLSYEHVFKSGYGFGIHGILEKKGAEEIISGYIGPSFVFARSVNSWTYSYSIGLGYGRYGIDSRRYNHEDRSGLGSFVQIEGERRLTKWLGIGAGFRVLNITVTPPDGFNGKLGERYGTGSLRFTIGPRFYF